MLGVLGALPQETWFGTARNSCFTHSNTYSLTYYCCYGCALSLCTCNQKSQRQHRHRGIGAALPSHTDVSGSRVTGHRGPRGCWSLGPIPSLLPFSSPSSLLPLSLFAPHHHIFPSTPSLRPTNLLPIVAHYNNIAFVARFAPYRRFDRLPTVTRAC